MEGVVVLDTCVLFEFMAGRDEEKMIEAMLSDGKAAISVITVYELFRGVETPLHIQQGEELINLCKILELSRPIARKAAEIFTVLKRKGTLIANEDILIGATSLHWKYPVLTSNIKDFRKLSGIEFHQSP